MISQKKRKRSEDLTPEEWSEDLTFEKRLKYLSPKKKHSPIWEQYHKKLSEGVKIHGQYICNHCGSEANYRNSTNRLHVSFFFD